LTWKLRAVTSEYAATGSSERGKMKRIEAKTIVLWLLLSLLLAMSAFAGRNASGIPLTTLRVDPENLEVQTGSDFQVNVVIESPLDVFYDGIILTYNTSAIDAVNVSVPAPFQLVNRIINDSKGFVLVEGAGGPVHGTVTLASFVFRCTGLGGSTLNIADYYVDDSTHTPIQVDRVVNGRVMQWFLKPGYEDYAPNGVPDFDQRQGGWRNPVTNRWSWSGPAAVADDLWWLDSANEPGAANPSVVNDGLLLVRSYGLWDDHDPRNVSPFIGDLAWSMDTDGVRTGISHGGTRVVDMAQGIEGYLSGVGLTEKLYVQTVKMPMFKTIYDQLARYEDTILLLGFWQEQPAGSGVWVRVGGHYVTVPGIDLLNRRIAFCDPFTDNAETIVGDGFVRPSASHGHPSAPPETVHNNASYVSYDVYNITAGSPSRGVSQFGIAYEPYYLNDVVSNARGQNTPGEFESLQSIYNPALSVTAEVEYSVFVSCRTGTVVAGSEDSSVYVWDFHGTSQWSWNLTFPVVSVAMDDNGRFVVAGTRSSTGPVTGNLTLFDNALGTPPCNIVWSVPLPVSLSFCNGSNGTESKSVDVKNNTGNGLVVVAASDNGLSLFDHVGNLIWHYWDGSPETIVRISQDGNYLVSTDYSSGVVHFFSHLRDGIAGWGPGDGAPLWSFGGGTVGLYAFWTAVAGLGDYVALSAYPVPVVVNQQATRVILLNRTGSVVWQYELPNSGFVKVDIPHNGRSVVSVSEDRNDTVGGVLNYWTDLADSMPKWGAGDANPVWNYWPSKEMGNPQSSLDDFYTVAVSENGDYVATGGAPASTYLLAETGVLQQRVGVMPDTVTSVDLTFSGKFGASGDKSGSIWFFDNATGFGWSQATAGPVHSVAVSKIYPSLFPVPDHDIAVSNVTTCKDGGLPVSTISQNYTGHVWVEVENQGGFTGTFTVTLYVNNTFIAATTVNLGSKARATLTFVWNTTGFAMGNYTITAFAEIGQDETDVLDNAFTKSGVVKVSGPGDVNGDGVCDMKDVDAWSAAFFTKPGMARWNPNADINDDHIVNMRDLGIISANFGKHY